MKKRENALPPALRAALPVFAAAVCLAVIAAVFFLSRNEATRKKTDAAAEMAAHGFLTAYYTVNENTLSAFESLQGAGADISPADLQSRHDAFYSSFYGRFGKNVSSSFLSAMMSNRSGYDLLQYSDAKKITLTQKDESGGANVCSFGYTAVVSTAGGTVTGTGSVQLTETDGKWQVTYLSADNGFA